ncbi:MAG: hypothetical protein B7733_17770 [Myxococcales bacterium FL481]|nr:MAG: hypothetical protein B7733_17770 [Myxococcales bacterium FL481]
MRVAGSHLLASSALLLTWMGVTPPAMSQPASPAEPAKAAPAPIAEPTAATKDDPATPVLEPALDAWRQGKWAQVRQLLEPRVANDGELATPERTEMALRYLADASLFDPTLDEATADGMARRYIIRLMDTYPGWEPPAAVHGPRFYEVWKRIREAREAAQSVSCEAENLVCQADLHELNVQHDALQDRMATLQTAYDDQEVVITERIARSRGPALIPLGVGHFYNGRPGIAGLFLGLEAIAGGAGLGLLINRQTNLNCVRTNGFQRGSLVCTAPSDYSDSEFQEFKQRVKNLRNWEQGLGFAFLGLVAADIIVAQFTFEPFTTQRTRRVPRRELDRELLSPPSGAATGSRDATIRVTPGPAVVPGGAGLGVHIAF